MKKNMLFQVILLSGAITLGTSCKKVDDHPVMEPGYKQISYMVDENDSTVLSYDADDHITKSVVYYKSNHIYKLDIEKVFKYTNGQFTAKYNYYYDSNGTKHLEGIDSLVYNTNLPIKEIVFSDTHTPVDTLIITYNSNNQPIKSQWSALTYNEFTYATEGNVTSIKKVDGVESNFTFLYDTKVNPYKGNNLYFDNPENFYSTNNITKRTYLTESKILTYEYDADGYPTKITTTWSGSANYSVLRVYYK